MKNSILPLASRIDLKPVPSIAAFAASVILLLGARASGQTTGFSRQDAGPWDYNDPLNWSGQNINGLWSPELALTASQTVTFGADTVLSGPLSFGYAGAFNQTLRGMGGDWTLTLGGDVIVDTVASSRVVTVGSGTTNQRLNVDLGGVVREFKVTSGRTLTFSNVLSNGGVTVTGGTVNLSGVNTYTGLTTVNAGTLALNSGAASIANSDVVVNGATFSAAGGNSTITRAKSLTLNGAASFNLSGASSGFSVDQITNAITLNPGAAATVTVTGSGTRNAQLTAASFVRNADSTVLFRGTSLGASAIASGDPGVTNISFQTAPALSGAGPAGTSTVGIIVGAYGDSSATGSGFGATGGLVTYDASRGVRPLDLSTEYKPTISAGQTQLDNVRLAGVSGTPLSVNLASPLTTIGSLSISATGSGTDSGVSLTGEPGAVLKVASGVIYASQTVTTPTATDTMLISVPTLDLNGQEGVIISSNTGQSGANGNHNAPLEIQSVITNDGGNGITKAGPGSLKITGSEQSTYSGDTVMNAGILYLAKSTTNIALPENSTLVINGGTVLQTNNQIPDTASVVVNGGSWAVSNSTSNGNRADETIKDLVITGGVAKNGQTRGGVFNILGSATVAGGSLIGVGDGSNITISGLLSISNGGVVTLGSSVGTNTVNSRMTLNGGLAIANTVSGAYVPLTLSPGTVADRNGGRLNLAGDVSFTGNPQNSNTATIDAPAADGNSGVVALLGVRTWNVGDGAAAKDLTVVPALTDFDANGGGIVKTGGGTLDLAGASTYTGSTDVQAGTLVVSGSLNGTSSVNVSAGAVLETDASASIATSALGNLSIAGTLSPGGSGEAGRLTLSLGTGGKLNFASASTLKFDLGSTTSDLISFETAEDWLGGSGQVTLSLGGTINYTATYTIFENVTTAGFTFSAITGYDAANYSASVVKNGSDYKLSFAPVPEPGTATALFGGIGLLLGVRRSRRK